VEGFHGSTDGNIVIANGGKTKNTFNLDSVHVRGRSRYISDNNFGV
jgi:hypothetical protein